MNVIQWLIKHQTTNPLTLAEDAFTWSEAESEHSIGELETNIEMILLQIKIMSLMKAGQETKTVIQTSTNVWKSYIQTVTAY